MVNQRTIDEILSSLTSPQKETFQNLRHLIKDAAPETVEVVKQGKVVYRLNDRDFVWISHFSDHVDLEFAMGASLSSNLLKTRGNSNPNDNIRHVRIDNLGMLKSELTRLVKKAKTLGFEHCQTI
jgi:hypothetical protein